MPMGSTKKYLSGKYGLYDIDIKNKDKYKQSSMPKTFFDTRNEGEAFIKKYNIKHKKIFKI